MRKSNSKKDFKNRFKYLFLTLVIAFALAGCSKEYTVDVIFTYGITTFESDSYLVDLEKVQNYIATFNLPEKPVIYTGKGKSESDAKSDALNKAKKDIELWLANFKDEDIEALNLDPSTRFIWSVSSGSVVVGEFWWNLEIVY